MTQPEDESSSGVVHTSLSPDELREKTAAWATKRSRPEVFIVESLRFEDEEKGFFEGRILSDVLKMCGKRPEYFYFRTVDELVALADLFDKSQSRYLHISCHGSPTEIETTLDRITLVEFAKIFGGKLNNRRVFFQPVLWEANCPRT